MEREAWQRLTLRIIGIAGAALFAAFFVLTRRTPTWIEDFAADYLEARTLGKLDALIDGVGPPRGQDALSRYAAQVYAQNESRIAESRALLKKEVRDQFDTCIPQLRALSAEQREKFDRWVEHGATVNIGTLSIENSRLAAFIQSGYLRVARDLRNEIRIFTASNAALFLLLTLLSFLRPAQVRALFVPAILLVVSTLCCAYLYVFEQNWLLTMIQGSYLGYAYDAWLLVAFGFLCDVWFNGARVTIAIIDAMSQGLLKGLSALH